MLDWIPRDKHKSHLWSSKFSRLFSSPHYVAHEWKWVYNLLELGAKWMDRAGGSQDTVLIILFLWPLQWLTSGHICEAMDDMDLKQDYPYPILTLCTLPIHNKDVMNEQPTYAKYSPANILHQNNS